MTPRGIIDFLEKYANSWQNAGERRMNYWTGEVEASLRDTDPAVIRRRLSDDVKAFFDALLERI